MPKNTSKDLKESSTEYTSGDYFQPVLGARYKYDYQSVWERIYEKEATLPKKERADYKRGAIQYFCKDDLFFLMYYGLSRIDLNDPIGAPFFVERCKEAELDDSRTLDLWAREHGKSSIRTIGKTIQRIFRNPESTTGIFSHTRPIAKGFLGVIRGYLEDPNLINWFPEILYENPGQMAPSWGLDSGITVKRNAQRSESTVEAWGLVDSLPVGKHFLYRNYDDVVDEKSVTTAEQIKKAKEMYAVSHSLGQRGTEGGFGVVGTRYHYDDPYADMIKAGDYKVHIHTCYGGLNLEGIPVVLTPEELQQRKKDHGSYKFSCQYLMQPIQPGEQRLKIEWFTFYDHAPTNMNTYIVVDPANQKKKNRSHDPDFTVMWVVGFAADGYVYVLDGRRGRMNLEERWKELVGLVRKWKPMCSGYERYGKDSDIQHFEYRKRQENINFDLVELAGSLGKFDRIQRLQPLLENRKLLFPRFGIPYTDTETNRRRNLVDDLISEEVATWPYSTHDDMLDCLSRIEDRTSLGVVVPYEDTGMRQFQEEFSDYAQGELEMDAELLI